MSDKKENIINVHLDSIVAHPEQNKIYKTTIDADFQTSIEERGILQPIIIAENWSVVDGVIMPEKGGLLLVSGHRRSAAQRSAGKKNIPAILKHYDSPEEINIDFLGTNIFRNKTKGEKTAEILAYKQILCQITKHKENHTDKVTLKTQNEGLLRYLTRLGIDYDESLNTKEIIQKTTGASKHLQELTTIVYDEYYYQDAILKLMQDHPLKFKPKSAIYRKVEEAYNDIQRKVKAEEISLNQGAKYVKNLFKETHKHLLGNVKQKVEKKTKIKVYIAGPISSIGYEKSRPNFENAANAIISALDCDVVIPHDLVPEHTPWSVAMRRDLPVLLTCDAICLIDGWWLSCGACLEALNAYHCGLQIHELDADCNFIDKPTEDIVKNINLGFFPGDVYETVSISLGSIEDNFDSELLTEHFGGDENVA